VVAYLIQGSWGIPVFAGGISNPLWLFDCKAGYLISFVFAAFAIGKLSVKAREHWFSLFMALILGQALIFTVGSLWLSLYIGMKSAVLLGVLPFLSGAGVKILLSAGLLKTNKVEK
jgi:biotin transport system substrate-specific component